MKNDDEKKRRSSTSSSPKRSRRSRRPWPAERSCRPTFPGLGGCIVALCTDAEFRERDPLFTTGTKLRALNAKADAKEQTALLSETLKKVQDALRQLDSQEERARYEATLKSLDAMIRLPLRDRRSQSRAARQQAQWKTQLTAKQEEIARISANPLLAEHSPPLTGRLMAVADGAEIPLMEIEFSW